MDRDDIKDVFQPYDRLVEIEICGEKRQVPENNSLLRCFQYLSVETISYGDFCWNGTCLNCQVTVRHGAKDKSVISCRTNVQDGMSIVSLADAIELD